MDRILWEQLNKKMNEIGINDCSLKKVEGAEGALATPYSHNADQWQKHHNDPRHELHPQVKCSPILQQ